jgi:hypothetical protein
MSLTIGLVGLPNVGKSTTFNALTQAQNAEVANYPFCTIQPNRAVVAVPDPRLEKLAEMVQPERKIPATIEFVDIAGLVKGASQGEGLGNQFLGHIRETQAIVHVVRCFDDPNVIHTSEVIDPVDDIETIVTELILADLEQVARKLEKLPREVKGDKSLKPVLDAALALQAHLDQGHPAATFPDRDGNAFAVLNHELRLLTAKPVIYAANVDEESLAAGNDYVQSVRAYAAEHGAEVVVLCAQFEAEMIGLTDEERAEFMEMAGDGSTPLESGLDQVIHGGFHLLDLIVFFTTTGGHEVRAWTLRRGSTAPEAAGVIHTDFQRGFIRAEVIPFPIYAEQGGESGAKSAGLMRLEGKEYMVQDGDVIHFRFNV